MTHYRLALLGFGNVGKALARLLLDKRDELKARYQLTFSVTGIATGCHGMALEPDGIDLEAALAASHLSSLSVQPATTDAFDFIRRCEADVLFENTPVDYQNGQPAVNHLWAALERDMHAITANKGPVVHAYRPLSALAQEKGRKFYFESTVMDGTPIFSLFRGALPAARLLSLRGVLNSTTNMILTLMEKGYGFEQAVAHCQKIGIAETDPIGDIDGWDAAVKVAALVTVLMDFPLTPDRVERKGIREITAEEIERAKLQDKRWKLVCEAQRVDDGVRARVAPAMVGSDSLMYTVDGTTSIVQFDTDVLGKLSVLEQDPGPHTTAYGLFADFLNAVLGG